MGTYCALLAADFFYFTTVYVILKQIKWYLHKVKRYDIITSD